MKRRRTRRRTWRRTRRRCGGLGGIGGIRSGNRIVPTRKAISGGGGIGSSISGTTQTAAASRIVMEASTKIGTSMHEGQQQRRRSCRGGQKSGGVDDDIGSSSHQRWRCGRGGGKSGGVDGDIRMRKEAFERQKMAVDVAEYSSEDSAASAAATASRPHGMRSAAAMAKVAVEED